MSSTLAPLLEATRLLEQAWAGAGTGSDLGRAQLIAVNDAIGLARRTLEAVHAEVAAGIARESRRELGPEALAKQQGFRNTVQLIATTTGASTGDAARLVKVGEAVAPRTNLIGEPRPAKFPLVGAALSTGRIGALTADVIVSFLERIALKTGHDDASRAEQCLVEKAPGLSLDEVRKVITRLEAHLDPDGVAPREDVLRERRTLTMFERDGMLHLTAQLDPASAAPVRAAIAGFVSAEFAAKREGRDPDAPDADRRPVAQIQADALVHLAEHDLSCERTGSLNGATVVVRVDLDDLVDGTGSGTIDGITQPVSVETVRRMAAGAAVIPWVCGAESEPLDWGRSRRLFSTAQRLALAERDGRLRVLRPSAPAHQGAPHPLVVAGRRADGSRQRSAPLRDLPPPHPRQRMGHPDRGDRRTREGLVLAATARRPASHAPPRRQSPHRAHGLTGAHAAAPY